VRSEMTKAHEAECIALTREIRALLVERQVSRPMTQVFPVKSWRHLPIHPKPAGMFCTPGLNDPNRQMADSSNFPLDMFPRRSQRESVRSYS
jgi:hypothetical protein